MNTRFPLRLTICGLALLCLAAPAMLLAQNPGPPSGGGVAPVFVSGNPSCVSQGYALGFKPQPEPPPDGVYPFPGDLVNTAQILNNNGSFFDWTSTLGVDAVIVKGGPNANLFVYQPPSESFGDTLLHAPINPNNNQPFGISHVELCYDYEVDVEKSAETTFTRTFHWDIEKSVTPSLWNLFGGDSGTSKYTVAVTKTGFTDSDWAVSGEIWIDNATPFAATITGVSDAISGFGAVAVDCGVAFPHVLASGASLHCDYATALPDGASRTNQATVTTSGQVGGGSATAPVVFGTPTTVVDGTVQVDDTNGMSWQFSDSGSQMYTRTFACGGDQGQHNNVATIVETGQNDAASVSVACHALEVEKTAETSLTRTWEWTIEKTADQTDLVLSPGQQFLVTYWVDVDATPVDSDWAVAGEIWIENPNPVLAAQLTGVADVVSPAVAAVVDCPALVVPAGGSLHCTYGADLPDGSDRTNTATATLQNHAYDPAGIGVPAGTTDFSGNAAVGFAGADVTEIDECIDVEDSLEGPLGTVCADQAPASFHYSRFVGPFEAPDGCGEHEVDNTASFVTNDTGATSESTWTVHVLVPCEDGCTLTPGYWKTHSQKGPAPYDDTWALLDPLQEDAPFFLSGQTFYEVLWTPARGNAYYILARAYIASVLNVLDGASTPAEVADALDEATDLFESHTPDEIGALRGGKKLRKTFLELAGLLDLYNNGDIGPGHCSE